MKSNNEILNKHLGLSATAGDEPFDTVYRNKVLDAMDEAIAQFSSSQPCEPDKTFSLEEMENAIIKFANRSDSEALAIEARQYIKSLKK